MFKTLGSAFKNRELRKSMIITVCLLLVYRLGCFLPTPGLSSDLYSNLVGDDVTGVLSLLNAVTGSALANSAIFALGVTPYINASIIVQLLAVAIPPLQRLSKEGDEGRQKMNLVTKITALVLALAQGLGIVLGLGNDYIQPIFGENLKWLTSMMVIVILMAGTCFTMWLGDKITEQGVGNGLSLIIFVGIIGTSAQSIWNAITSISDNLAYLWELIGFFALVVLVFFLIVFVDMAERKINVQYAKQVKGRKMYGGQSTHIPMKVNSSGVMPLIFSYAILSLPDLIMNLIGVTDNWWLRNMGAGSWAYTVVLCLLILFFSYFYNQIQFNPDDVSKSIQGNGGFIPGYRPGKPTADYLKKVSNRITLFGAVFLALVALVPSIIFRAVGGSNGELLVNVFSATGLLIVVSVALEFEQALQSQIMMKQYKGILK